MRPEQNVRVDAPHANLKPKFIEHYRKLLGDRYEEFIACSMTYLQRSVRINTLKSDIETVRSALKDNGWETQQIPWCREGFWVHHPTRRDIGNVFEHQLGYFYIQESASMIPPVALDPQPGDKILDMCAAPGSKTSQIAQYMQNKGVLIANDVQAGRLKPLGVNLQKLGVSCAVLTKMNGAAFKKKNLTFDRILVDAPCSGTGTVRKSFKTLEMWSPGLIEKLSRVQYDLLQTAFNSLRPGGTLVYSTCTLEPLENEGVVSRLLANFPDAHIVPFEIDIVRSPAVLSFEGVNIDPRCKDCLRIYPQDNDSEGFFVAKIQKKVDTDA
jgi:NOL1/NOP2/sun family putative RNA methylase